MAFKLELLINKRYIDYKVYFVIRLKDKFGYKVKLIFDDGTDDIRQIEGFIKKGDANNSRNIDLAELYNRTYVVFQKIKMEIYLDYWLEKIIKPA